MKTEAKVEPVLCPKCDAPGVLQAVGSASGRGHYRCSGENCGNQWREKNPAIVAAARLGGLARAAALTPERREEIATNAGNANRRRILLRKAAL
jgi:hypothetical protein